jgi:hypothetical protein
MDGTQKYFDDLLKALERARIADEELHRRNASLSERVTSHDTLSRLRAEIAQARKASASGLTDPVDTHGPLHESGIGRI